MHAASTKRVKKKQSKNPHKGFLFWFFFSPQAQKDPECIKSWGFRVIGNTSVVATKSFSFQILCLQSYFCCLWALLYRSHKHIESKKSKGHSLLGFKLQANLFSPGFQQFVIFCHLRLSYLEVQYIVVCERKVNFSSLWISFSSRYFILDGGLVDRSWKHPKEKRK